MDARSLILLAALCAWACGPRPRVESTRARSAGGREIVDVLVRNAGGEGTASVTVRLRARGGGPEFVKEQGVPLPAHGSVWTAVPVEAPGGDYEASAEARYPP
jgi:hypothetical protein